MTQPKTLSFHKAVGSEIQRIRENHKWRQEELAEKARREWGLRWNRATVAAIETGKRELSPIEFFLLLPLLELESYSELFPKNQAIAITPEVVLMSDVLRHLLPEYVMSPKDILDSRQFQESGVGVGEGLRTIKQLGLEAKKFPTTPDFWRRLKQHAAGDAEQKAARYLRVQPMVISVVSYNLWNRSLSEERDSRALELLNLWSGEEREFTADEVEEDEWLRRRLQTFRGHATRELLRELERVLKRRK